MPPSLLRWGSLFLPLHWPFHQARATAQYRHLSRLLTGLKCQHALRQLLKRRQVSLPRSALESL